MWELDCEESWVPRNWCFWTVVLEKTLESPLDCKEIQPVHPKGDQSWVFIGRTDVEAETPIIWPPDVKSWLFGKDPDAEKVLHSICQQIWKTQQWPQDWKRSVFIPIPKGGNAKECSNYHTIALISHAKVMLKILQARLQQYMNRELPDVQAAEKAEEPEIKLPTSAGSRKKQESSRKTSFSALLTMPKPLTVWITINCGKFWKWWEYQTT